MSTNIVSSTAASALRDRWERLRSHKRIISRIKLLVEWDQGGAKETANAVTVDVSHSGCMAVVGADLPLHRRVRLIHPETGRIRRTRLCSGRRSEEHTSELQSQSNLVCRLLLEKKKNI